MQKQKKTVAIGGIALSIAMICGVFMAAKSPSAAQAESTCEVQTCAAEQLYDGYCGMGELTDTYTETINYDHKETERGDTLRPALLFEYAIRRRLHPHCGHRFNRIFRQIL